MTFSVVARDDSAGLLGVAVASCVLAVGARVPLARPGVGAVAVQGGGWLQWRQLLLDALDRGLTPQEALTEVRRLDVGDDAQIAVVGAAGPAEAYTGAACPQPAGHAAFGPTSVQANTMANDQTWPAMREAFEAAGDLTSGLLAALAAADREGGDVRGRQSAALLVVPLQRGHVPTGDGEDPTIDLRVDDSRDPIGDLQRLVRAHTAHRLVIRSADEPSAEAALTALRRAAAQAPDDPLCAPAAGIALGLAGHLDEALKLLEVGRRANPHALRWARWRAQRASGTSAHAQAFLDALRRL